MKKVTINVSYDDEKLFALRLYLGQKNATVEAELESALESLYGKTVPANVREFLEMKTTGVKGSTTEKKKKPVSANAPTVQEHRETNELKV